MCIFVGLTDFVNRGVPILVDEMQRYRNYPYYYLFIYLFIYLFYYISVQHDFHSHPPPSQPSVKLHSSTFFSSYSVISTSSSVTVRGHFTP